MAMTIRNSQALFAIRNLQPPPRQRQRDSLRARLRAGLVEDRVHVELHGPVANTEPVSDFSIGQSLRDEGQPLVFARRKGV